MVKAIDAAFYVSTALRLGFTLDYRKDLCLPHVYAPVTMEASIFIYKNRRIDWCKSPRGWRVYVEGNPKSAVYVSDFGVALRVAHTYGRWQVWTLNRMGGKSDFVDAFPTREEAEDYIQRNPEPRCGIYEAEE